MGEDAAHLFSMRVAEGDEITVSNLKGKVEFVKIWKVDKKQKRVEWKILESKEVEQPESKVLFQAITDKTYLDKMCEALPLAGVTDIHLFSSDRSVKQNLPLERLQKILIRSCEQGEIAWMPTLYEVQGVELEELFKQHTPIVLDCAEKSVSGAKAEGVVFKSALIGPEGGWSKEEQSKFKGLGLETVSLGDTIYPAWLAGYTFFIKAQKAADVNSTLKGLGWNFKF